DSSLHLLSSSLAGPNAILEMQAKQTAAVNSHRSPLPSNLNPHLLRLVLPCFTLGDQLAVPRFMPLPPPMAMCPNSGNPMHPGCRAAREQARICTACPAVRTSCIVVSSEGLPLLDFCYCMSGTNPYVPS